MSVRFWDELKEGNMVMNAAAAADGRLITAPTSYGKYGDECF